MMVSSAGEAATSGVSLVDIINVLIINIFAAVATGGAVVTSQFLGQKRKDKACQSADQLILVTGVVALVIMALSILLRWQILNLIYKGVTEEVMKNAVIYLTISAISYPFLAVYNSCAALFRSMGNSQNIHAGIYYHECDQCDRRCTVYLRIPLECGRRCRCVA